MLQCMCELQCVLQCVLPLCTRALGVRDESLACAAVCVAVCVPVCVAGCVALLHKRLKSEG